MSGDFSQSVGKCSILSRNTHKCVSPFVSFEKRFFERGGLKKEEERNKVGGQKEVFMCGRLPCDRWSAATLLQGNRHNNHHHTLLSEAPGYPAEAESAMTGSPNTATGGSQRPLCCG